MANTHDLFWLHTLRHQAVRDLAWCALSEPLMTLRRDIGLPQRLMKVHFSPVFFYALDHNPSPLLDHLAQYSSHRLGYYYEALWHFLFDNTPNWQVLYRNLPVYKDKQTLGAFDFLCVHESTHWHIETAVKFYLYDDRSAASCEQAIDATDLHRWFGPNREDQLAIKVDRLLHHQLPLNQHPIGRLTLHSALPTVHLWQSGVCFQGYLFWPAGNAPLPYQYEQSHIYRYKWWRQTNAKTSLTGQFSRRWLILEKMQWLSPAQEDASANTLLNDEKLFELIATPLSRPLLVALLVEDWTAPIGTARCVEVTRFFIVPDDWSSAP